MKWIRGSAGLGATNIGASFDISALSPDRAQLYDTSPPSTKPCSVLYNTGSKCQGYAEVGKDICLRHDLQNRKHNISIREYVVKFAHQKRDENRWAWDCDCGSTGKAHSSNLDAIKSGKAHVKSFQKLTLDALGSKQAPTDRWSVRERNEMLRSDTCFWCLKHVENGYKGCDFFFGLIFHAPQCYENAKMLERGPASTKKGRRLTPAEFHRALFARYASESAGTIAPCHDDAAGGSQI